MIQNSILVWLAMVFALPPAMAADFAEQPPKAFVAWYKSSGGSEPVRFEGCADYTDFESAQDVYLIVPATPVDHADAFLLLLERYATDHTVRLSTGLSLKSQQMSVLNSALTEGRQREIRRIASILLPRAKNVSKSIERVLQGRPDYACGIPPDIDSQRLAQEARAGKWSLGGPLNHFVRDTPADMFDGAASFSFSSCVVRAPYWSVLDAYLVVPRAPEGRTYLIVAKHYDPDHGVSDYGWIEPGQDASSITAIQGGLGVNDFMRRVAAPMLSEPMKLASSFADVFRSAPTTPCKLAHKSQNSSG